VFAPVIRIVRCHVMREDRWPSAAASREHHNERSDPDCEPPATYRTTPKRTTDARRPVRSNVAHTDGRPASPSASPSSQEVTICSSESSCWWPWRSPSSPAGQGPRVHRVPRPWHRSTRQPRAIAVCRASPPRRRDLTRRRLKTTPGPAWDPASCCPAILRLHAVVTRQPTSVVRGLNGDSDIWSRTRVVTYPGRAHKPQLCG
jgi:hypothetical protein